jgi:hypothetical protein
MSTVVKPAVKSTLVMFSDEAKVLNLLTTKANNLFRSNATKRIDTKRRHKGEPANVFYTEATADALLKTF